MPLRPGTERRVLDAAEELFTTQGIAATPVDAVLERSGVSAATLYRGWSSKEALVAAALGRRHDAWLATWDDAVAAQDDDRGRLLAVFDALDTFRSTSHGSRWCAFLGAAAEYAEAPPELAEVLHRESAAFRERLTASAEPLVGASAASALAEQLLLVVSGALAMRLRAPGADTLVARSVAAALVDAALLASATPAP